MQPLYAKYVINKARLRSRSIKRTNISSSSLVRNKPSWLCPGEFKLEVKQYFRINIGRVIKWSLQIEIFAVFTCSCQHTCSLWIPFTSLCFYLPYNMYEVDGHILMLTGQYIIFQEAWPNVWWINTLDSSSWLFLLLISFTHYLLEKDWPSWTGEKASSFMRPHSPLILWSVLMLVGEPEIHDQQNRPLWDN